LFHCQNKTNKAVRYGNILILFYRSRAIGRVKPRRWIFHPGDLTWRALVECRHCSDGHNTWHCRPDDNVGPCGTAFSFITI